MRIVSIIVCYGPDVPRLLTLCETLNADGSGVVLVDNTEHPYLARERLPKGSELITLGRNTGIAHAQNVGVAAAKAAGAEIVVFFDQDSTVEPGFLRALVEPLNLGTPDIVSPLCRDASSGAVLPSVQMTRYGTVRPIQRGDGAEPYEVDIVISSGTAATREVFEVAGGFDEAFFIDFVDTEWCLRCRSKRIPIRAVPAAVMRHRIGSHSIVVGGFTVFVHSPVRCYYQLRNCLYLFGKGHIPVLFALRETVSVFLSRALLLLFVRERSTYLKAYWRALRDGMKGVTGARPG